MRASAAAWAALLALAGCGASGHAPVAQKEVLFIGTLGDFSTPKTDPSGIARGLEMAIDKYNRSPDSRYDVRLKKDDTGGQPQKAMDAAADLAKTERLIGVVGPFTDAEAAVAGPILEKGSIPFLVTAEDSTSVPQGMWRSFRRLVANDRQQARALVLSSLKATQGPVAIFHEETPAAKGFSEAARQTFEEAKQPIPRYEKISPKTEFGALGDSVAAGHPSIVVVAADAPVAKSFVEGLKKSSYKGPVLASGQIWEAKAANPPEGVQVANGVADPSDAPLEQFVAEYKSRYSSRPPAGAAEANEGAQMLLEAAQEVEPKARVIKDFFALNRSFLGDSKSYDFNEAGELRLPVAWIYQVRSGSWTLADRYGATKKQKTAT